MSDVQLTIKQALKLILHILLKKGLKVVKNPVNNTIEVYNKLSSDAIAVILSNGIIHVNSGMYKAREVENVRSRYVQLLRNKNISLPC